MLRSFVDGAIFGEVEAGVDNSELWVLLHGWSHSLRDFDAFCQLAVREKEFPWIARFDLPGFGNSPEPTEPIGSKGYGQLVSRAIKEVLDQVPQNDNLKVVVVGHSFGGKVALNLTGLDDSPLALAGLVLSGAPLIRNNKVAARPKLGFRLMRFLARHKIVSFEHMEKVRERYGSSDYRNSKGMMREIFVKVVNEDSSPLIRKLSVPTLLLWGDGDSAAPIDVAWQARELCPRFVSVESVAGDHFVVLSDPSLLLRSVIKFSQGIGN